MERFDIVFYFKLIDVNGRNDSIDVLCGILFHETLTTSHTIISTNSDFVVIIVRQVFV